MKRLSVTVLVLSLVFSLCACMRPAVSKPNESPKAEPQAQVTKEPEQPQTREFTDDCGRTVTIPYEITSVAVSGPLAQIYCIPLCIDIFSGVSTPFPDVAKKYIPEEYVSLPELGQLYGGKGTMDLEALLDAAPDVVIDVGEKKGNIVEDLDGLTKQTGIPFVHIDATMETAAQAYTRLGELTGKTDKAAELSAWLEKNLADVKSMMQKVDADGKRATLIYCLGDKGLNVLAKGSYHAETLNLVAENSAVLSDINSSGMGNEIDMEQIMQWNPEYIIFAPNSIYSTVGSDTTWQQLDAIRSGNYFETPNGPYGWLQSPPSVQRYLGMLWLGNLLYPDYCDYDLQQKVTEYYKLFYDNELTDEDYAELTEKSLLLKNN